MLTFNYNKCMLDTHVRTKSNLMHYCGFLVINNYIIMYHKHYIGNNVMFVFVTFKHSRWCI